MEKKKVNCSLEREEEKWWTLDNLDKDDIRRLHSASCAETNSSFLARAPALKK